jgi:hypothetical protein
VVEVVVGVVVVVEAVVGVGVEDRFVVLELVLEPVQEQELVLVRVPI